MNYQIRTHHKPTQRPAHALHFNSTPISASFLSKPWTTSLPLNTASHLTFTLHTLTHEILICTATLSSTRPGQPRFYCQDRANHAFIAATVSLPIWSQAPFHQHDRISHAFKTGPAKLLLQPSSLPRWTLSWQPPSMPRRSQPPFHRQAMMWFWYAPQAHGVFIYSRHMGFW